MAETDETKKEGGEQKIGLCSDIEKGRAARECSWAIAEGIMKKDYGLTCEQAMMRAF